MTEFVRRASGVISRSNSWRFVRWALQRMRLCPPALSQRGPWTSEQGPQGLGHVTECAGVALPTLDIECCLNNAGQASQPKPTKPDSHNSRSPWTELRRMLTLQLADQEKKPRNGTPRQQTPKATGARPRQVTGTIWCMSPTKKHPGML